MQGRIRPIEQYVAAMASLYSENIIKTMSAEKTLLGNRSINYTMSTLNYINLVVFASGLFPLFILIYIFKIIQPKYHGYWIFGIIFILISGLLAGSLNLLGDFIKSHADQLEGVRQATFTVDLWLYIIPASIAAMGVNLISQYLVTSREELLNKSNHQTN